METSYDFEAVWLTSGNHGTPHASALAASNPGLVIHTAVSQDPESEDGWRNCDRNIRNWWKKNDESVTTRRVLFLEWDVLANVDLRTVFPPSRKVAGIEGARVSQFVRDGRGFLPFREVGRLPQVMQPYAIGLAPLAVVMASRPALDAISNPLLDFIFDADVFSELRLPTVIRHAGFSVTENPDLRLVECRIKPHPGAAKGIFHAIKAGGEG